MPTCPKCGHQFTGPNQRRAHRAYEERHREERRRKDRERKRAARAAAKQAAAQSQGGAA